MKRAWLLIVLVAGCSPDAVPIGDYDAQLARADCDRAVRCHQFDTVERCLAYHPHGPITTSIVEAVRAALVDYDGVQAAECVAEHEEMSCARNDLTYRTQPSALCRGVLRAGRRIGDQCVIDAECDSRSCTASCSPDTCCIGFCVEAPHLGSLLENCSTLGCAPNLWCDTRQFLCEPFLPRGATCYDPSSCDYGLDCADTCQPTPHAGDPCLTREQSGEDPWCGLNDELACDVATMTCQPSLGLGAACDPGFGRDRCQVGWLRCDPDTRTCVEFPKVGETCTNVCEAGAFCSFTGEGAPGVCLPLVDDGSPCFDFFGNECASGACNTQTGLCVEPAVCT